MKYVVCVPDGCADEPLDELGGRTPLEAASMPVLDRAGRPGRGRPGRRDPRRAAAGQRRRQHVRSSATTRPRYHTGRAPIEAAALGLRLAPDQVAYRCNLVTVGDDGDDGRLRRRPPVHRGRRPRSSTRSTRELGGDGISFHPGVQYRHIMVAPAELGRRRVRAAPRPVRQAGGVAHRPGRRRAAAS